MSDIKSSERFFHNRLSLRRPKSATTHRVVTERQHWGMNGQVWDDMMPTWLIMYILKQGHWELFRFTYICCHFTGSSASCVSPFGSPACSASSWLKKTISAGRTPSLPNQSSLCGGGANGSGKAGKKKYSFLKVTIR